MLAQFAKIWTRFNHFSTFNQADFTKTKITRLENRSLLVLNGPETTYLITICKYTEYTPPTPQQTLNLE